MTRGDRGHRHMKVAVARANEDHDAEVARDQANWDNEVALAAELREDKAWRIQRRQYKLKRRHQEHKAQGRW